MKLYGITIFPAKFQSGHLPKVSQSSGLGMGWHTTEYSIFCGFSLTRFCSSDKNSILALCYANKYIGEEEGTIIESGVSRPVFYTYGQKHYRLSQYTRLQIIIKIFE